MILITEITVAQNIIVGTTIDIAIYIMYTYTVYTIAIGYKHYTPILVNAFLTDYMRPKPNVYVLNC